MHLTIALDKIELYFHATYNSLDYYPQKRIMMIIYCNH